MGLGVSWVWLGLEGEESAYAKLNGTDTRALVQRLPGARHPRARLEHRRPRRARRRQHRRGDRPRGRARHRVPPVHAVHAGAGHAALRGAPGERHAAVARGVPRRRHARTAPLQLPAPADPERRGDGVPAARVPPRLRGERAERHPHRAHAASAAGSRSRTTPTRACASGSPSRRRTSRRSTRERSGRPRRWFARSNATLAARLRATRRAVERAFGWKARLAARIVGPVVLADALARAATPAQRPDLRAPDVLRGERHGRRPAGGRGARRSRPLAGSSLRPRRPAAEAVA